MANHYDVPSWAGKPPTGLHLDVLKGDKLIQKLMLDEKKCYLFGRNPQMNDFCIDHASCSRVHAAFVYHKHLDRAFLVDLGSTHGTYIGQMRLESNKPTQLPIDSNFHFGASTRNYIIRERPSGNARSIMEDIPAADADGVLLGLPETQTELDNLTEFNTAHNRRISMLGIQADDTSDSIKGNSNIRSASSGLGNPAAPPNKRRYEVSFNEDVDIINPEDVDPSVGRFRNLVKTTIVPTHGHLGSKRMKLSTGDEINQSMRFRELSKHLHPSALLYQDIPAPQMLPPQSPGAGGLMLSGSMSLFGSRLGLSLPNPAPDVDLYEEMDTFDTNVPAHPGNISGSGQRTSDANEPGQSASNEPKKKKYAKEAWPGRKVPLSGV